MELGRLLTAMLTPFDSEGKVDYEQAKRLALALIEAGSDGVVVAGTTGECPTLTNEEKTRLFGEIKQAVGNRGSVVAGTGTYNTAESIEMSVEAQRQGADAVLLTTPYYSRPPQEGLYRHFAAIADAVSISCVLYNIPGRTAVNVTVETQLRLAEIPNIVGVKEASGDLVQIARIIAEAGDSYRVWSGDDQLTLPILSIGGYGVIAVAANLVATQMKRLVDEYIAGNTLEATAIHQRLLPLMTALMTLGPNPVPIKYAVERLGFPVGGFRLPLCEPDAETGELIMAEVRRHQIDLAVAV